MMTRRYGLFLSCLFCAFLFGLMALHLLLPDREKSPVENRTLAQRPAFALSALTDGSFMEDTEEYLTDQFPFRDGWTGLKARAEQLLGKREFHQVYLCGDTLIHHGDQPGELAERNLGYVSALAGKTRLPIYLGLIPTASEVWQGKLPAGADRPDQAAFIAGALEKTGLPAIDYLAALTEHREEPVYYRTDHHWTILGAWYGYNALCSALGADAVKREDFTPETVSREFNGTLYSQSGIHWLEPDTMEYWVPEGEISVTSWRTGKPEPSALYDRSYLSEKDKYSSFLGGNQPLCLLENPSAPDGRTLLVVRDSYADSMAPFLAESFQKVVLLDLRTFHRPVAAYAEECGADVIVISYSVQNFITDKNLLFLAQ